ncbi:MAG: SRPBCC family protein [Actinomycetota bacterium]
MSLTKTLNVSTPTDREIMITRQFDAPRELVFDAMSQPALLRRWLLGPPGWSMVVCEVDQKVGGAFRHVWRNAEGAEMAMRGVYREVVRPERMVRTEIFESGCDAQAAEQVGTLTLIEQGGGTTLTLTVLFPSREARDAAVAFGMERGVAAGYDRLEELLASTAAGG